MSDQPRLITVRELMQKYTNDDFSFSFDELKALLAEAEAETPEEVRHTLTLSGYFDSGSYYGDSATCEVIITRDETGAEVKARVAAEIARTAAYEAKRRLQREASDREEFARLKAKFEQ